MVTLKEKCYNLIANNFYWINYMKKLSIYLLIIIVSHQLLLAKSDLEYVLGGFGTIGGAYNDNNELIFIDNKDDINGALGDFSSTTDTKLGVQLDVYYKDYITLTVQGIVNQVDKYGGNAFLE